MTKGVSIYLDMARFLAAATVLVYHFLSIGLIDTALRFPYGGAAVTVFFVISGYVIAFVVDTREKSWHSYSISRFARLYSVVIPALILALIIDWIGAEIDPEAYIASDHEQLLFRVGASLLFINQIWNFTIAPMSIGPYWSLSFEFFYYLTFGAAVFAPGWWRFILPALVLLVAGPRIAVYMPLWLLGVAAYHLRPKIPVRPIATRLMFLACLALFVGFVKFGSPLGAITRWIRDQPDYDRFVNVFGVNIFIGGISEFPPQLTIAAAFAGTLIFCDSIATYVLRSARLTAAIRFLASHTFSIYLYHAPLLIFFDVLIDRFMQFDGQRDGVLNGVLLLLLTVGSIFVLGRYTENRKGIYVDFFKRLHLLLFAGRERTTSA